MRALSDWLSALDAAELTVVLGHRPDALRGVEPRGPVELAQRLAGPYSIAAALQLAPTPVLELLEALLALGVPDRQALLRLLDDGGSTDHVDRVDQVLGWLRERAIVWPDADADADDGCGLAYPGALHDLMPTPLGLGMPARRLLEPTPAATLNKVLTRLGLPRQSTKHATLNALVAALSAPERVRALVASAPSGVADELGRLAFGTPDDPDAGPFIGHAEWQRRQRAVQWASEHGLLVGTPWGALAQIPAEVALALRGWDFRAPFHPVAPDARTRPVDAALVDRESRVALAGFADRCASVLDLVARAPVKTLKSGGLGVRELDRMAKQTGCSEPELRLVLELAYEIGLLTHAAHVAVSEHFAGWRASEPEARCAELLWAWWRLPGTPTQARDEDGKPTPALRRRGNCQSCLDARQALVAVLGALAAGESAEPAELLSTLRWARPLVHLVGDPDEPAVWQEAEQLGVLAHGSRTDLGLALAAGDAVSVQRLANDALPAATDRAVFGSDLTAVVTGTPSARVSAMLDAAADRESRGRATVWRFSAGSVRRALDEGADPDGLLHDLVAVATGELPQPLRYLVGDVGRRHGSIRVRDAECVLVVGDEALAAQVAADRSLRSLRLRQVAPTVLLAGGVAVAASAGLRKAGYLPVREDPAGVRLLEGVRQADEASPGEAGAAPAPRRPGRAGGWGPAPAPGVRPADPSAAAARILSGGAEDDVVTSPTELLVARYARRLAVPEVRLLAQAVDAEGAVTIEYVAASGGHTVRTISKIDLVGGQLSAWCHLRTDERQFALDRIRSVAPAVPA